MQINTIKINLIIGFLLAGMVCCKGKETDENGTTQAKYYLAIQYSIPYEILVNDLLVSKDTKDGYSGSENLNLFLNTNGKQKIKIRVAAVNAEKGGIIPKGFLKSMKAGIYLDDPTAPEHKKLLLSLDFPDNKDEVSYFEQEWEFNNDLKFNYGSLSDARNLSDMDQKELEKEVLAKFVALRMVLNSGDGVRFLKIIDKAKNDLFVSENISAAGQKEYNQNLASYFESHKGIMPEIQNFRLRIMGNGRAVALENIGSNNGLGVLTALDKKNNSLYKNYFILYVPKNSNQFEVFRYNCYFTSLD